MGFSKINLDIKSYVKYRPIRHEIVIRICQVKICLMRHDKFCQIKFLLNFYFKFKFNSKFNSKFNFKFNSNLILNLNSNSEKTIL